ncbi:MAG TPA: hypothetical protein VFW11_02735 [Cyclobacteriaceae bacterium]|nr:hypothetical protein [Cyclobacteriaceae bacterium]
MNALENQSQVTAAILDEDKLYQYHERLRLEQNLPMALVGGFIAAIIGASLWAIITIATGFQIGFMAVGVGFVVGYTVRYFGKGIDKIFGIVGAILALAGCLLGNFLTLLGIAADQEGFGYIEILQIVDYSLVPAVMIESFSPMDLLFYGIAIYEGYRFSFRHVADEDLITNASKS